MRKTPWLIAVTLPLLIAACGSDDESTSDSLRPAGEVVEEKARGEILEPGETAKVGKVEVTADNFVFEEAIDDDGTGNAAMIKASLRIENRSDDEMMIPLALVTCADGSEGSWYVSSTLEVYAPLPPDTFAEGDLVLGVPPNCDDPVLRLQDFEEDVNWRVPASALS